MVFGTMRYETKTRLVYAILIALVIPAGLATRAVKQKFPWLGDAAGDALWATMAFFIVSFGCPTVNLWLRAIAAVGIAFAVEFGQLYHAPWIDSIRRTTLGAMVLGSTFVASDLVCYVVGVAFGVVVERWIFWRRYSR